MRRTPLRALLACAAVLTAAGLAAVAEDKKADDGFTPVFNGRDFTGWKFVVQGDADPKKTWSVQDGVIVCTGKPNGYFYTDKSYKNYVIRYDWQYKRPANLTDDSKFPGNSGCLVHIQPPHRVWPKCVEVQGMNRDHGKIIFVGFKGATEKYDREAKNRATKPVGQWNTTEITCKPDGTVTAKINGTPVSSGKSELTEGVIGFQSEGAEIHFKNIKLKQLP